MKSIVFFFASIAIATSVHASEIKGASCVSPDLNERGLRYVVEIGEALFGPKGEFYTSVNKYYDYSQRYPEVNYSGNSKLRFEFISGKIEAGFSDRIDPAKFSLKIISGLTFSSEGEVTLTQRFKAKLLYGYFPETDAIVVECIH